MKLFLLRRFLLILVLALSAPSSAAAHEFHPGVLALQELAPGKFRARWSPPVFGEQSEVQTTLQFPPHCRETHPFELDCGDRGLYGSVSVKGQEHADFVVNFTINWADGSVSHGLMKANTPIQVRGASSSATIRTWASLLIDYVLLGGEHILQGLDHVLFVLGLILVIKRRRSLVASISAFTVAHSITLVGSTLGDWTLPSGPVEATIALSVLLVAYEATLPPDTWTHRLPWVPAFAFGLLHGFGFAGALGEIGLPPHHAAAALLSFNVGVEMAQLGLIGIAIFIASLVRKLKAVADWGRLVVVYGVGSYATILTFERVFDLL